MSFVKSLFENSKEINVLYNEVLFPHMQNSSGAGLFKAGLALTLG
jgi:hypothetical protein